MHEAQASIGVFDSGVGGLTVVRRIMEYLPHESIVYLGDTARVPYGAKSASTVIRYAKSCANLLAQHEVKMMVVACNTASSCALPMLEAHLPIPVVGVIEPGARAAIEKTQSGRIGVIGTSGAIASEAYPRTIHATMPEAQVFCKACPLFVPLAEEGWLEGEVPERVASAYLSEIQAHDIDTLVLGCTHYPLLHQVIAHTMGDGVSLVDSAQETARTVQKILMERRLLRPEKTEKKHRFLVSDAPNLFCRVGERFLGEALKQVEWVDF